ncbi:MAG: aconitate hydratase AcnA [Anaerolineales bacterium]|jgi:aconitate hydratase
MKSTKGTSGLAAALSTFDSGSGREHLFRLEALEKEGIGGHLQRLPYSIRILLESLLRNLDSVQVTEADVEHLAGWDPKSSPDYEVPFKPARVLLQDFTGVPAVVDLAAMRSAMKRMGGDPRRINPLIPVDLVIDHSVQVDEFGTASALFRNAQIEFERNRERYQFLRWGQQAFRDFRVVPPATGIVHQVNLEYLGGVVLSRRLPGRDLPLAIPDTLVGTDSHTTMINGLGVLGWGVGGIEAEAVMLGQPLYFLAPRVVGFRLQGELREGVTATDLVLTVAQRLRQKGVVDQFVEFYGPGVSRIALPDRATIGNMSPEYGATCAFFPVDEETLAYLRRTGRPEQQVVRVERYCKEQGLFRSDRSADPEFSDTLELDLGTVEPSLAGPRRPQDRVPLRDMKKSFQVALHDLYGKDGKTGERDQTQGKAGDVPSRDGDVVIAAITSCTNTSNPSVMVAAGLLAKKAVERGLRVPGYVKTSLAPGSKVVSQYLQAAGLQKYLDQLGFNVVGYGCTTCIGNSGPLSDPVANSIRDHDLVAAAVLSGNRNFEGRIHPLTRANYLASPPLVVAFALAGTIAVDLESEPLGRDPEGKPVFLREIWPSSKEILTALRVIDPDMFRDAYAHVFEGNEAWNRIAGASGDLYAWDPASSYIQEPPFFEAMELEPSPITPLRNARILAIFGDSVTTDHISPAGDIPPDGPAGAYLRARGIDKPDFNSFGARRGNHEVMLRGTFANIRIRNQMVPGKEGGYTLHLPEGKLLPIYEAAMNYKSHGVPLVVLAGKEYGTGSSRDWAAKGTALLGVRAVIAQSFERIHRANLVGMGVLPLQFHEGESANFHGLTGRELISILGIGDSLQPGAELEVEAKREDGSISSFKALARLDTPVDLEYYRNGGILPTVLRQILRTSR